MEDPELGSTNYGRATLVNGDCLRWMRDRAPNSIHAVVTDPPYGLREFSEIEKVKLRTGRGGVWRIPPEFDGCKRMPLPRFTTLHGEGAARDEGLFCRVG